MNELDVKGWDPAQVFGAVMLALISGFIAGDSFSHYHIQRELKLYNMTIDTCIKALDIEIKRAK
jgi:hypothetical protein